MCPWHPRKSLTESGTLNHCTHPSSVKAGTVQMLKLDEQWRRRLDVVECNKLAARILIRNRKLGGFGYQL